MLIFGWVLSDPDVGNQLQKTLKSGHPLASWVIPCGETVGQTLAWSCAFDSRKNWGCRKPEGGVRHVISSRVFTGPDYHMLSFPATLSSNFGACVGPEFFGGFIVFNFESARKPDNLKLM